ncbi:hypothetical protein [Streptomyces zaomyceticus]|uniref:hypothetical protein n=1 Tax=Streptomyces zaomyceticus TaxID=68286 RepID=UPI00369E1E0E
MAKSLAPCPMPHAHKRLMDCHAQWHSMREFYFSPDDFRLHLNAFLQTHRSVSGLLLKHQSGLPGFNEWFTAYSDFAKQDEILKWAKKSRNRIVHEADLELESSCRVRWIGDWRQRTEAVGTFPPRMSAREIVKAIKGSRGLPPFGTLTIERRWVDRALPERELLDATSDAFSKLHNLLRDGHQAADVALCDLGFDEEDCVTSGLEENLDRGALECMENSMRDLVGHFSIADGTHLKESVERIRVDESAARAANEGYGGLLFPEGDAIARVPLLMSVARRVMEKDGVHGTFAFCLRGDEVTSMRLMQFENQGAKHLAFESLADEVESSRADGVLIIGEMWMAVQTEAEKRMGTFILPAREGPDRREGLSVYAVTRDGRYANQVCFVERTPDGKPRCGEPFEVGDADGMNTFLPIKERWKRMEERGQ